MFREMKQFSIRAPLGGYRLLNHCSWRGNTVLLRVAWRVWLLDSCGPAAGVYKGSNGGLNSGQAERPQVSRVSARHLLVTSLVGSAFWVELLDVLCVCTGVLGPRVAYLPRL